MIMHNQKIKKHHQYPYHTDTPSQNRFPQHVVVAHQPAMRQWMGQHLGNSCKQSANCRGYSPQTVGGTVLKLERVKCQGKCEASPFFNSLRHGICKVEKTFKD